QGRYRPLGTNGEGGVPAVRCDGGDAGETRDGGDEGVLVISGATGAGRGRVVADLLAQLAGGGLRQPGSPPSRAAVRLWAGSCGPGWDAGCAGTSAPGEVTRCPRRRAARRPRPRGQPAPGFACPATRRTPR